MAEVNVLEKNSVRSGDKVVVTKTVEEHLTRQDLNQAKQSAAYQKQNLLQQIDNLKGQVDAMTQQELEIDELIKMLDSE